MPTSKLEANKSSTLLWVERQLEHCRLNHARCVRAPSSNYSKLLSSHAYHSGVHSLPHLPTRLLHLGRSNSDIKLWETPVDARGEYASLSHCWGSNQLIKTEILNIESFKNVIPWSSIPRTFRDAINFTRALNLQFLWIDSLCIIQDDIIDYIGGDWIKKLSGRLVSCS
jgi:hypothetical protein